MGRSRGAIADFLNPHGHGAGQGRARRSRPARPPRLRRPAHGTRGTRGDGWRRPSLPCVPHQACSEVSPRRPNVRQCDLLLRRRVGAASQSAEESAHTPALWAASPDGSARCQRCHSLRPLPVRSGERRVHFLQPTSAARPLLSLSAGARTRVIWRATVYRPSELEWLDGAAEWAVQPGRTCMDDIERWSVSRQRQRDGGGQVWLKYIGS